MPQGNSVAAFNIIIVYLNENRMFLSRLIFIVSVFNGDIVSRNSVMSACYINSLSGCTLWHHTFKRDSFLIIGFVRIKLKALFIKLNGLCAFSRNIQWHKRQRNIYSHNYGGKAAHYSFYKLIEHRAVSFH